MAISRTLLRMLEMHTIRFILFEAHFFECSDVLNGYEKNERDHLKFVNNRRLNETEGENGRMKQRVDCIFHLIASPSILDKYMTIIEISH